MKEVPDITRFHEIDVQKPADMIIQQIRALLVDGTLKPGMRLPSERKLAERFGVGRGPIREALKRLEFYGILRTLPQRGTVVARLGVKALEGLISNVLSIEGQDIEGLLETRSVLEIHSARSAAQRATETDLESIRESHQEFSSKIGRGEPAIEEDHLFHLKIANAS
ncbi:FadR/GntR family transcriptional regulator, partial [Salinispira pacifica]